MKKKRDEEEGEGEEERMKEREEGRKGGRERKKTTMLFKLLLRDRNTRIVSLNKVSQGENNNKNVSAHYNRLQKEKRKVQRY